MCRDVKPLSPDEFATLLGAAVAALDATQRDAYERYRIEPAPADCARYNDETVERLWVVAQAGLERIAYDDEEDEFGIGVLDSVGVLRQWGTWGTLAAALENFPESASE